jgi:Fe-S-cluster containining protein
MADPTAPLLRLYRDVDDATATFLRRSPLSACDLACADCCRARPPLVSREEAMLMRDAVDALPSDTRARVREKARGLALRLAHGMAPEFECPLLVDVDGAGRCSVYAARPYTCRTFGHTARIPDGADQPQPFACARLGPRVARAQPPPVPFRSEALRQRCGVDVLADSYIPVWIGLDPHEWEDVESGPNACVVVGRPRD